MNICHCLFFFKNDEIVSIIKKSTGMEIIKFAGNNFTEYTNEFWSKWIDYAGCTKDSLLDFCIVYDNELMIPSEFIDRKCSPTSCIWTRNKIHDTIEKFIDIIRPTKVLNEEGCLLFKLGSFRNIDEKEILSMTAVYTNSSNGVIEAETNDDAEMTPFIQGMVEQLEEYDKIKI